MTKIINFFKSLFAMECMYCKTRTAYYSHIGLIGGDYTNIYICTKCKTQQF